MRADYECALVHYVQGVSLPSLSTDIVNVNGHYAASMRGVSIHHTFFCCLQLGAQMAATPPIPGLGALSMAPSPCTPSPLPGCPLPWCVHDRWSSTVGLIVLTFDASPHSRVERPVMMLWLLLLALIAAVPMVPDGPRRLDGRTCQIAIVHRPGMLPVTFMLARYVCVHVRCLDFSPHVG